MLLTPEEEEGSSPQKGHQKEVFGPPSTALDKHLTIHFSVAQGGLSWVLGAFGILTKAVQKLTEAFGLPCMLGTFFHIFLIVFSGIKQFFKLFYVHFLLLTLEHCMI